MESSSVQDTIKCVGIWHADQGICTLSNVCGNFWKSTGFSLNSEMCLFAEEAAYLIDQNYLRIMMGDGIFIDCLEEFLLVAKMHVQEECIWAYCKIRSSGYLAFRKSRTISIFQSEMTPESAIENSWNLFLPSSTFSKRSPGNPLCGYMTFG